MKELSCALFFLICISAVVPAQQPGTPSGSPSSENAPAQKGPALSVRPAPAPPIVDGRIKLDVVVSDEQGRPVSGLDLKDFTVLDNKQAQKILAFQAVGGAAAATGPPVEVILLIDTVNATFQQVAIAREQVGKFLRKNGGHLEQPVSIFVFTNEGLQVQPRPSMDGNALMAVLDQVKPGIGTTGSAASGKSEIERFQFSIRTLTGIALNEAHSARTVTRIAQSDPGKQGRKLLIWIGPGWPALVGPNYSSSSKDRQRDFDAIVELSTRLREARFALYSVSQLNSANGGEPRRFLSAALPMSSAEAPTASQGPVNVNDTMQESSYKEFLRGVKSSRQADSGNLALQVLAVQSGGRVLDPSNDLAGQIANCVADLSAFYTISFDPPRAGHADEYHELKVQIGKPGLVARTSSGYYNQP